MAGSGTKNGSGKRDLAAQHLAWGFSVVEAAAKSGASQRSIFRWKADDPEFLALVRSIRADIRSQATGQLALISVKAAAKLAALLDSPNEHVQLGAVRVALTAERAAAELMDLQERMAAIEARLNAKSARGFAS